ncbi:MAG TPA: LysM peptidoglycan-binding domain-containing protein [Desulfobacterales bacterium]|nr:LysM peptidoglycan-binding domain-containing protein [Desulfobacterales bacterium]
MSAQPCFARLIAYLLAFGVLIGIHPPLTVAVQEGPWPVLDDFPLPESVSLCRETMPLENHRVWEMLDREFTIIVWDRAQVFLWLKRAGRYFPHIEKKLAEGDMPEDLKYLAVAESSLLTYVGSSKGAKGTWQLMSQTARRNGLRKDRVVDDRLNFERSTEAALKYLKELKDEFGTWTLAIAAYNCGEIRLRKEIAEQRIGDYYRLNLPRETERFIFRITAIKIIMENPERYGYSLSHQRVYKPVEYDLVPVEIEVPLHITDVAAGLDTDFKVLKELNPQISGYHLPTGSYTLRVPSGEGLRTASVLKQLTLVASHHEDKNSGPRYVVVRQGDTLSAIAERTGVSVAMLRRTNGIEGSLIMVGQKLGLKP